VGGKGAWSAYSKGTAMRIIGAETKGARDLYWYVKADSQIKSLKDTDGKVLAYSTNGSSTHGIVTAFMKQYNLKAKPTAMGGPAANLTAGVAGQNDVGWGGPPVGGGPPAKKGKHTQPTGAGRGRCKSEKGG